MSARSQWQEFERQIGAVVKLAKGPVAVAFLDLEPFGERSSKGQSLRVQLARGREREQCLVAEVGVGRVPQQPAGQGHQSGRNPEYSPLLARAAVAAGVYGLFLECHPEPKQAKSDAATMMDLKLVEPLLEDCQRIALLRLG